MDDKKTKCRTVRQRRARLAFLLPTYKSPSMCAELLYGAHSSAMYRDCAFVLLLDVADTSLPVYQGCVNNLIEEGMNIGFMLSDGSSYSGMINRISHVLDADSICVIDTTHIPAPNEGTMGSAVGRWLDGGLDPMRVGVFNDGGQYPVVTQKMIERMGYLFHPLFDGREVAERFIVALGAKLGVASIIPECRVMETKTDGVEILGCSGLIGGMTDGQLVAILEHEIERLKRHVIH